MVKIKLSRVGKKHEPHFRIVVAEAKSKLAGQYADNLGTYNPVTKDFTLDKAKYETWIGKGAQPTETVASIIKRFSK